MTKKWIAINLMMLAAVALLGWQLYVSIQRFKNENTIANAARVPASKKRAAPEGGLPPQASQQKINDAEFSVIPDQNLFAEIRKMAPPVDNTPAPDPPRKLDIIPVLVGVAISGSHRTALINDPAAGNAPGARRTLTMRTGDNYRGFVVTDITQENMVLEFGPSRYVIPLFDTSKPAQSGKTQIVATRVVNFGPGSAAATAPVVAAAARPGASPATAVAPAASTGPRSTPAAAQRPITGTSQSPNGLIAVPSGTAVGSPGPTWNTTIDAQGRVIMQSPFGTFQLPQQQQQPVKK
jgi:hypothetical protein